VRGLCQLCTPSAQPACAASARSLCARYVLMRSAVQELRSQGNLILEDLKEIRGESVKLTSRVNKLKSELEDILADDQDMLDMYLQRRHVIAQAKDLLQPAGQSLPADFHATTLSHLRQSLTRGVATLPQPLSATATPMQRTGTAPPADSTAGVAAAETDTLQLQSIPMVDAARVAGVLPGDVFLVTSW
jgi:hypothetical protein